MSYLEQQKLVEAENEERERRKIEDDLELKNEEAQKALENNQILHDENPSNIEDQTHQIAHFNEVFEYEKTPKVNYFI